MSGICTFLVAALTAWTFMGTEPGHRARRSALWSVGLLITEALLGAVLVLKHYVENNISTGRVVMQSVHLTNTMLLLAALTITAWFLGQSRRALDFGENTAASKVAAILAVVATLVVGATGSLAALADTIFPAPSLLGGLEQDFAASSPLLVRMRWIHPVASVIAFFCVVWLARRIKSKLSALVLGLFVAQVALGLLDILLLAPTWMQVVHLLGADLYWAALVVLAAEMLRPFQMVSTG
jgi:cytochrome c oxidase assembly protein subunit 15